MKISKEYTLAIIIGLFLLAYILETATRPLSVKLASPYEFLTGGYMSIYPFTTATVLIRSFSVFLAPLWLLSFIKNAYYAKGGVLLVTAGFLQLYAIQEVATGARVVPLEWSLSLSIGGAALVLPSILFIILGLAATAGAKLAGTPTKASEESLEE